jgi:hypothetical protein
MSAMEQTIKGFLESRTFLGTLARRRREKRFRAGYVQWEKNGSALPMPHYGKQLVVAEYAARFAPPVLVETGTYTGRMVYAMLDRFEEIYSIELDPTLAAKAAERFAAYRHVHIIQGESSRVLPQVLKDVARPCLFWLDAHYSGGATAKADLETPIMRELAVILNHEAAAHHVVLIDDARCFDGTHDYPQMASLCRFILGKRPTWEFEVCRDIIRTHAPSAVSDAR